MKILNVSPLNFNYSQLHASKAATNPQLNVTNLQNTLSKDTVSFSGKKNDEELSKFGLLREKADDEFNIKTLFNIDSTKNDRNKIVLNTLECNLKNADEPVLFFGQEKDFAKALAEKSIKTKDFETRDDSKFYYISFADRNIRYDLKYDKKSGELANGSAMAVTKGSINALERIDVQPSPNKEDTYMLHYKLIQKIKDCSAIEDTYLIYKAGKEAPESSYTTKYLFNQKKGIDEKQVFAKVYDEDGFSTNFESKYSNIALN